MLTILTFVVSFLTFVMCFWIFEDILTNFLYYEKTKIWVHWNEMLRCINWFNFELYNKSQSGYKYKIKHKIYKNLLADNLNFKINNKIIKETHIAQCNTFTLYTVIQILIIFYTRFFKIILYQQNFKKFYMSNKHLFFSSLTFIYIICIQFLFFEKKK